MSSIMDADAPEAPNETRSSKIDNCAAFAPEESPDNSFRVNVTATGWSTMESHAAKVIDDKQEAFESGVCSQKEELKKTNEKECSVHHSLLGIKTNEAVVLVDRALCANYRSDSDTESNESNESDSVDSSSDSDTSSVNSSSKAKNEDRKKKSIIDCCGKSELSTHNLPPIEELKITVPEQSCIEIGVITSIVDVLVVVESYKGSAALDVDTVLFLDCGRRALGKVFEILGPVSEPVYAIRFNSENEIRNSSITKGLKVYYAPQTQHTTFVHMSDVLKCRGSDASWKDNIEAPSEYQDFSDDEEESKFKSKNNERNSEDRPLPCKRAFSSQTRNKIIRPARLNVVAEGGRNTTRGPRLLPRHSSEARAPWPRPQGGNRSVALLPPLPLPVSPCGFSYCPPYGGTGTGGLNPFFFPPVQMNIGFRSPGYLFPSLGTPPSPGLGPANFRPYAAASWPVLNEPPPPPPPPPSQDSKFSRTK